MRMKIKESEQAHRFELLIKSYAEVSNQETQRLTRIIDGLIPCFQTARKLWAEGQRRSADNFNLFEVMEVENDEVCHSKILAWLLDHRIERGTHAQGNLGFRLFREEIKLELEEECDGRVASYADEPNYWVHREVSGIEARVDIEIAARSKFLIHIENKILSAEGVHQTEREWKDLQARRKELVVPETACHAIFLTLDGAVPPTESFVPLDGSALPKFWIGLRS